MWQINWTSFNMALDWSQLCILPARQSYIRQYGKMASISITDFATYETHGQSEAVGLLLLQISGKTGWWWHSYEQVCVQWWGDVPSVWSETDLFLFVGICKDVYVPPLPTTLHELKTRIRESSVQTLIRKFSTTCGRRLNIGLILLEPLVVLTLKFINDISLIIKLFQLIFQLVRVL
jgi:hypothetical protein